MDPIQRLFSLSVDMLGTASADGFFTQLNPAWEQTLGWTREELMAEPFVSFVHPDDVQRTLDEAARVAGPGRPLTEVFENRYRTRDGSYRWIEWTTVGEHGISYFVAKDITDRRAAEAAQRESRESLIRGSEALHQTLTANLPDTSVFLLDQRPPDPRRRWGGDPAPGMEQSRTCSAASCWPTSPGSPPTSCSTRSIPIARRWKVRGGRSSSTVKV